MLDVAGAYELPQVIRIAMRGTKRYDGFVALGCIVRGETDHYEFICKATMDGILGAEWRLHPNFALYADYTLNVSLFTSNMLRNRTTVTSNFGGTPNTNETTTERTVNGFLSVSSGLSQGASLGLEIFF